MANTLSYTLAQINPVVGDLDGNAARIVDIWRAAESDLVIFPELVLCGYPPEDLILRGGFVAACDRVLQQLAEDSKGLKTGALIPAPAVINGKTYNAAYLVFDGEIVTRRTKHHLPNYGVFDEKRIFAAGDLPDVIDFKGHRLGVMICEDMWHADVAQHLKDQGAEILIVPNGSPWRIGKEDIRAGHAQARVSETGLPLLYVNQVGGQDELVFDGGSFVMDAGGFVVLQAAQFEEDIKVLGDESWELETSAKTENLLPNTYKALTLGIRDYVLKNEFQGVLLGLSGGIDSTLTAALAVDALGAENVHCVMLPSSFTSDESIEDAQGVVDALGCSYETISITEPLEAFERNIPDLKDLAHENIQSRIRGTTLMALSNASGKLLLTTGNKSEMAVGYATLYGDMNGAFNALKDVYKTQVYALSEWRNTQGTVIPERILTKAPTAELRDNQTDQDSLPDYDVLDAILEKLIEGQECVSDIVNAGFEQDTVEKIAHLLRISEYKRNQAPPGVKITARAFGRDWRYPMTNRYTFDE